MPARNDSCPCGSGKKYKRCCQPEDDRRRAKLAVVPGLADRVRGRAGRAEPGEIWEAAIVPMPFRIDDTPDARPGALLIVAGGIVLHVDVLPRPPSEPAEIAAVLAEAVAGITRRDRVAPRRLRVAHASVAEPLRAVVPDGVRVEARAHLGLDALAADLFAHLGGGRAATNGKIGMASTWRGWGLPEPQVRELFVAAAAFYRAAPWRDLLNEQVLELRTPAGARWTACVLGNGGAEFGLALYADPRDFERQMLVDPPSEAFAALKGPMVAVTFSRRNEVPPAMRKEVLAAGWEVASPTAYPGLLTVNTPAGGVTIAQASDLTAALRAVPGFVAGHRESLRSRRRLQQPVRWTDSETGVALVYTGPADLMLEPL